MTRVTVVVIVTSFLLSPQHLANRPLSGQLFAILAMFFLQSVTPSSAPESVPSAPAPAPVPTSAFCFYTAITHIKIVI